MVFVERYVIGRFLTHEEAGKAGAELGEHFAGNVSISSTTPHEHGWKEDWLASSLGAIGGAAATVSHLIPGFGVLFIGGPLDGVRQGKVLAEWYDEHAHHVDEEDAHFLIVTATEDTAAQASDMLKALGAVHVHVTKG